MPDEYSGYLREGIMLDRPYLDGLRKSLPRERGGFLGYGVGTNDIVNPPIDWRGGDTTIQMTGVNRDLGSYDDPDTFYREHGGNLSGFRGWLYRRVVRHRMNRKVESIRGCRQPFRQAA